MTDQFIHHRIVFHPNIISTHQSKAPIQNVPQEEVNPNFDRERVIENLNNLQKSELPHLSFEPLLREPSLENAVIQQILNPLHRHLPLLLHRLVVIRRHEHLPAPRSRVEQPALHHQVEQPIPIPQIVAVHQFPHRPHVERSRPLGRLRRRVAEARRA